MKLDGYYSSGQFAKMAGVSLRTIRFYDKQNILKPSYRTPSGARFYTEKDFAKLQQILLLKYLGFSLEDIKELSIDTTDYHFMYNSLKLQKKLIQDKIEQMQLVENAIENTISTIEKEQQLDYSYMLELIHLTGMEESLKTQYRNAENVSARIRLHKEYSINKQGWFPWIFQQCELKSGMRVLELGCGNGALWTENMDKLPKGIEIVLSDISDGMLRDARRAVTEGLLEYKREKEEFSFQVFDCKEIPFEEKSFDLVIANHLLFYCDDVENVCREVHRVLKEDGKFVCSTYGSQHMKEITHLVQAFDSRILLAAENLYERFGLENGCFFLDKIFSNTKLIRYEDRIELNQPELLLEYILSCHGNQNQILLDRYKEFKSFVTEKTRYGFTITKDAGIFISSKKNFL